MTQVIPLTYYSKNNWIPLAPLLTSTIVPHTMRTMDISPYITSMNNFEMFHRDEPSKAMSELYKYFYHHKPFSIKFGGDKKKESWWDYLNPFACDTDYEEDGEEAYDELEELKEYDDEYSDSSEFFKRRKMKKINKQKLKKKKSKTKIKKKKILIKFVIGFLAFLAIKFLLEKLWYIFPTIFPTTARDELLNEVDLLLEEGIELDRGVGDNQWRKAKIFEVENRAFFSPKYKETKIDFAYPMKSRIITYF